MTALIREADEQDAKEIAEIYAPIVSSTTISFEISPPSTEEMAQRIRKTTEQMPWLVCEHNGTIKGYAYASPYHNRPAYRWTVDVSVYVHETSRRRGVGHGLYESLLSLLRQQGFCNALAVIALPNDPSVEFHESFGFERIGIYRNVGYKFDRWHDVGHWQLSLRSPEPEPSSPVSIAEFRKNSAYDAALKSGENVVQL